MLLQHFAKTVGQHCLSELDESPSDRKMNQKREMRPGDQFHAYDIFVRSRTLLLSIGCPEDTCIDSPTQNQQVCHSLALEMDGDRLQPNSNRDTDSQSIHAHLDRCSRILKSHTDKAPSSAG